MCRHKQFYFSFLKEAKQKLQMTAGWFSLWLSSYQIFYPIINFIIKKSIFQFVSLFVLGKASELANELNS